MYIYGKNVAKEVLQNNSPIFQVYMSKSLNEEDIIEHIRRRNLDVKYAEKNELDRLVNGLHQGIVLKVPDYKYLEIEDLITNEEPLIVILDHLEDPHNFGAIIRTCEAAGVDGIIIPKDRSVEVNSTVMKVSAGTLNNIKIAMVTNLNATIKLLKQKGFWIVGTDMNGTDYDKIDYKGKMAVIVGNEGDGMSRLVTESCDFIASIPMNGKVNSLNASVATAIVVFEATKQRR